MSINLTTIIKEVEETKGAVDSAITFLNGLKEQIAQLIADLADQPVVQAKLQELATALDAEQIKIADAIAANPEPPQEG